MSGTTPTNCPDDDACGIAKVIRIFLGFLAAMIAGFFVLVCWALMSV